MVPNFTLSKELLSVYEAQLSAWGYEKAVQGLDDIIANRSSRDHFPSVKEIKYAVEPTLDPVHQANEAVSQIISAVSRCGPYVTPIFSELAAAIVSSEGGWQYICEILTNDNLTFLRAQWRDLALAKIHSGRIESRKAELSDQRKTEGSLTHVGSALEQIGKDL